jgi:hypothetical protein
LMLLFEPGSRRGPRWGATSPTIRRGFRR